MQKEANWRGHQLFCIFKLVLVESGKAINLSSREARTLFPLAFQRSIEIIGLSKFLGQSQDSI